MQIGQVSHHCTTHPSLTIKLFFLQWLGVSLLQNLKSDSHLPKKFLFICFNESPLKIMKNAFYFILKALFVLKITKFLSLHFGHVEE